MRSVGSHSTLGREKERKKEGNDPLVSSHSEIRDRVHIILVSPVISNQP